MNDLTLKVTQNPGSIELNFDELEKQLDFKLAEYKGAVFTEESKDIAKKEVANLRKLRKDVDDARKTVKKEWMKPYDEFEAGMKRLIQKVDEPITFISGQVGEFEEKRKKEKRKKINTLFAELVNDIPDYEPYITLDKVYDPKWENASVSIKAIKDNLTSVLSQAIIAVDAIKAMRSDKEADALRLYARTMDMTQAIQLISTYEQNKAEALKKEEERRKREEEDRLQKEIDRAKEEERRAIAREEEIRQEERAKAENETRAQETKISNPFLQDEDMENSLPFEQPMTRTAIYKVVATMEELEQVEMAFNSIGIYFERRDA